MSTFTDAIQAQIDGDRQRHIDNPHWRPFEERDVENHTIGDFINAVLRIDNPETAKAFFDEYVAWIPTHFTDERVTKSPTGALDAARSNIGWCYGEGMKSERVAMWRQVTGSEHPIGKIDQMTPEQIFDLKKIHIRVKCV